MELIGIRAIGCNGVYRCVFPKVSHEPFEAKTDDVFFNKFYNKNLKNYNNTVRKDSYSSFPNDASKKVIRMYQHTTVLPVD